MSECTKGKLKVSDEYGDNCIIVDSVDNEIFDVCPNDAETGANQINDNKFWASGAITKANADELVRRWNAFEEGGLVEELEVACEVGLDAINALLKVDIKSNASKNEKDLKKIIEFVEAALAKS